MKLVPIGVLISMVGISYATNASPPTYSITDLGLATIVEGFGNNDQVIAADPSGDLILFHPNGTMTDLTILVDDSQICFGPVHNGALFGVSNNNGSELALTTEYFRSGCAMTYQAGNLTYYNSYLEGGADAINDSGQILGNNEPGIGNGPTNCDFSGSPFGGITAELINDSGQIVGNVYGSNTLVLCTQGTWAALPQLPNASSSSPAAINSRGAIAGTAAVKGHSRGFFISAKGVIGDLGIDIQINDINVLNQFVGNHTTGTNANLMREDGVTYDLVTLINPADPLQPYVAFADYSVRINDNGVIAVIGTDSRSRLTHLYLLKPI